MKKSTDILNRESLESAQIFFKFAFGIQPWSKIDFIYYDKFIWGGHIATKKELKLSKQNEQRAVALLHHIAIYLLATQIDTILEGTYRNRFKHRNRNIRSASWVARLIRNSFTHNPFSPRWLIDRNAEDSISVKNIIKFDTKNLSGKFVEWSHFGGPIALLRLSEFIKNL